MRTTPRPPQATIGHYYPKNYGPYTATRVSPSNTTDSPSINRFISKALKTYDEIVPYPRWKRCISTIMQTNATILPALDPGNLLEVGCASGSFLYKMASRGWSVTGIE